MDVGWAKIQKIEKISETDLRRMIVGYQSPARYRVEKIESELHTSINLNLEILEFPYHKTWDLTKQDINFYQEVVTQGHSLAAFDGEYMVGLGLAEPRQWNRTLWIWEFHVLENFRRLGIGRQMMQAFEEEARWIGMRALVVETQNTNVSAIRFYRAVGFTLESIDLSYYTNQDTTDFEVAIFMKRKLG
jgi:ribosomal protein S18 acetylase RimI-like enzyme